MHHPHSGAEIQRWHVQCSYCGGENIFAGVGVVYGPGDLITCQCCLLSGHGGGAGILNKYNSSELRNTGEMGDGSMYKGTKKQD